MELEPVLLWTNSAPTSAFAAQTIPLDLTPYKRIRMVRKRASNSSQTLPNIEFPCEGGIIMSDSFALPAGSTQRIQVHSRNYTLHNALTGINVSDANLSTVQDNIATNNTVIIPYKIYGLKH